MGCRLFVWGYPSNAKNHPELRKEMRRAALSSA